MAIDVRPTGIPEVLVIEPEVYGDERGFFFESFNLAEFEERTNVVRSWVQDNHSRSSRSVLRGLHYQLGTGQGKLVRCTRGAIFDVAVDIRRSSPTFRGWVGVELSEDNFRQLWVPEGFAHGFLVLSDLADVQYKTTTYYDPENERGIRWDDPSIGVEWPLTRAPNLSPRDQVLPLVADADVFD